jgi:photosystem II stability/assembly factor-like uncharacterized protein
MLDLPEEDILFGVSFADSLNGIAAGRNGRIFLTSDGGKNWHLRAEGLPNTYFLDVSFPDPAMGIVVGYQSNPNQGLIMRTTDGGRTWSKTEIPGPLLAVSFANSNFGIAVGNFGTIQRTTDGGRSWKRQSGGVLFDLYGVY